MNDSRFQRLKFQIFNKKEAEIQKILKPLCEKYECIRRLRDNSPYFLPIMCYFIFLYDPGTDLNLEYFRLEDRKNKAAELGGLNKIKDLSLLNRIMGNTTPDLMDIIQVLFTQVYHDRKYREWQTLHNELDEYTRARWEKIDTGKKPVVSRRKKEEVEADAPEEFAEHNGNKKSALSALTEKGKLREECKRIHDLLDQLELDIFGDHKDVKQIAYKSRFLSPESFSLAVNQSV